MGEFLTITDDLKNLNKKFRTVIERFPKEIDITTQNVANLTIGELQRNTPKQSGNLSRGYFSRKKAQADYIVTNNVKTKTGNLFVSDLLEKGTKAHGPKKAKALRFVDLGRRGNKALGISGRRGSGKVVFAKFVKGIKAMKIFEITAKKAKRILVTELTRKLKLILVRFNK